MNQLESDLNMGKNHLQCRECKKSMSLLSSIFVMNVLAH